MIPASPAVQWIRTVAIRLDDLVDDVVFLGGATLAFLISDPGAIPVRPTKDVDVVGRVAGP